MGWGNIVIIRHIFLEEKQMKTVDSVYAHLDRIFVQEGKQIVRGQQIGTIGTNRGRYVAHLHFEIRKNLFIGYNQRGFPKDLSNYYIPGAFIAQHRKLHGAGRSALVAVNTFNLDGKGSLPLETAGAGSDGKQRGISSSSGSPSLTPSKKKDQFRVNRFSDLFWNQ
jgi:murein DD-endopeptidase MepM/ murein hydrolase activator NlpD